MIIKYIFCGILALAANSCSDSSSQDTQELQQESIYYADPTVILEDGIYYMTGTGSQTPAGFTVLMSDDLQEWSNGTSERNRYILNMGNSYGTTGFWAPQWFKEGSTWYFAYTANEQTALAEGDAVTGPFRQDELKAIDDSEGNIDPFIFKDDDGKYYLYHVRFNNGNYIWVAEFDIENATIDKSTLQQCLDCTETWENTPNYISDPIMEGPTVLKLDGVYYLFYSANHYLNIDYAVGYATAASPTGPWTKYEGNPIISRETVGENGSGHGDIFVGKDGQYYYVYHVHNSNTVATPRRTRIIPLHMTQGTDGIYEFYVNGDEVIIPYRTVTAN